MYSIPRHKIQETLKSMHAGSGYLLILDVQYVQFTTT